MTGTDVPTVVLALDGLSFRYLDRFDLPNFERLRERGVEAPLRSTHPPWTGSAWPSMFTGVGPGHHGVYSFFDFESATPAEASVVSRNDVRAPAIWNYLDDEVVVLNMPVTHPAEPVDGVLIPGYLAPEDVAGHPEGIREELSDALGEPYRVYADSELSDDPDEKLAGYADLVDLRRRAAEYLLSTRDPSLAVVQVQKTDAVFHNFEDEAAFERVYAAADELIGGVLDAVDGPANVVVCSDHGMSPTTGYVVYVNEVLRGHGFVESTTEGGVPTVGDRKREWLGAADGEASEDGSGVLSTAVSAAETALDAVGVTPGDVYSAAARFGVEETLLGLLPERASVGETVDWKASTAYCRSGSELGVRINRQGRDPGGTVPPDEYHAVRGELVDVLSGLETPEGDPVFEMVLPRERVYEGPQVEAAPDVVFRPADMNHGVVAGLVGRRFVPTTEHNHALDGVFVGAGPGFGDAAPDHMALPDVAPTVMALLGRSVPERMTGAVPQGLLGGSADRASYGDVPYGTGGDAREGERVHDRLEDLGYL